jgi:hypothetical protein
MKEPEQDQTGVRRLLNSFPRTELPADIRFHLRVLTSREGARVRSHQSVGGRLRWAMLEIRRRSLEIFRPLAIPAAGGLATAIVFFACALSSVPLTVVRASTDVPTQLYSEARFTSVTPLSEISSQIDGAVTLDLRIDAQGKVSEYCIEEVDAACVSNNAVRRRIANTLLFTSFYPATSFGRPVSTRLRIRLQHGRIDVRG